MLSDLVVASARRSAEASVRSIGMSIARVVCPVHLQLLSFPEYRGADNAAAADDNRRDEIFRFVGMLLFHFHSVARGARFRANSCGAVLMQTSSMLVELCRSVERAISI